jgi:hypothetical protein
MRQGRRHPPDRLDVRPLIGRREKPANAAHDRMPQPWTEWARPFGSAPSPRLSRERETHRT